MSQNQWLQECADLSPEDESGGPTRISTTFRAAAERTGHGQEGGVGLKPSKIVQTVSWVGSAWANAGLLPLAVYKKAGSIEIATNDNPQPFCSSFCSAVCTICIPFVLYPFVHMHTGAYLLSIDVCMTMCQF